MLFKVEHMTIRNITCRMCGSENITLDVPKEQTLGSGRLFKFKVNVCRDCGHEGSDPACGELLVDSAMAAIFLDRCGIDFHATPIDDLFEKAMNTALKQRHSLLS